ncbi:protein angel homolog 1 isoform X2 [Paramisgurnus dabryanus]|uniref:protein angel homolog 1 isoform X2 n=1 Tax=Paramisgurnus dabryanus TaxID=90735 RepID=UPI0031F4592F
MIASLIYYALYPLTRFINSASELWQRTPIAYINGRGGCGDPSRQRILPELQMDLLQHYKNTTRLISTPEDTKSQGTVQGRIRETTDERKRRRQEELNEEVMTLSYETSVTEENTATLTHHTEWTEASIEDVTNVKLSTSVNECSDKNSDCALLVTEAKSHLNVDVMSTTFVREPRVNPDDTTEDCADVSCISPDLTAELHRCVEEDDTPAKGSHTRDDDDDDDDVKESDTHPSACCSDILLGFDSDGSEALFTSSCPVFDLRALLSDAHCVQLPAEPIGWHFPVGLGLSDVCYCPYVQFPAVSYYPPYQANDNIEVMWRVWEDLSEACGEPCADPAAVFEFSIMSYNILAQDLLESHPQLYKHCREEVLAWDHRLLLILQELRIWEPDIVCLQEVQEDHFLEQMYPVLTEMGYTCIYKRRTGNRTDGCAVCYYSERFTQLSVKLLEFYRPDCELLDRDNVGIVLLLQPITERLEALSPVCVANTHLVFNPRRGDVKLAQLAIVLAEIDVMIESCKSQGKSCEVILCGDFNALPNTPLVKFITGGQLHYHGLPAWMVSGQVDLSSNLHHRRLFTPLWPSSLGINDGCQYEVHAEGQVKDLNSHLTHTDKVCCTTAKEKLQYSHDFLRQLRYCQSSCVRPPDLDFIPGVTDNTPDPEDIQMFNLRFGASLFHRLNLTSAYTDIQSNTENCVLLTTLNSEGGAMVDYIFYSHHIKQRNGGLKLMGRLSLLSEADLWSLPNETFPSDHLSLLVRFQLG